MKNEIMDLDFNLNMGSEANEEPNFGNFVLEPMEFPGDIFNKSEK